MRLPEWLDAFLLLTYQHYILLGLASSMDSRPLEQVFPSSPQDDLQHSFRLGTQREVHICLTSLQSCVTRGIMAPDTFVMCWLAHPQQHKISNNLSKGFRHVLRAHSGHWLVQVADLRRARLCTPVVTGKWQFWGDWTTISPLRNS